MNPTFPSLSIAQHYRDALAANGDTPAAVLWPKGRQDLRFDALTRHLPSADFSLLDYGCGLAHLHSYLDIRFKRFRYTGIDMLPEFVAISRARHPDSDFAVAASPVDVSGDHDHVVMSGVFNMLYTEDIDAHKRIVWEGLEFLFARARKTMAINFMTDQVDFKQPGAFHLDPRELLEFARRRLSRRLMIDQSYMPFEYTMVLWKDDMIKRPDMVFG